MILYKVNKDVRKILSGVDLAYYLKKASEVVNDLIPQFALNGYGMQVNLTPNTMQPTNFAIVFLPENISESMQTTFLKLKEHEKPMEFLDIGKYKKDAKSFESYLGEQEIGTNNYQCLYQIIENQPTNTNQKKS